MDQTFRAFRLNPIIPETSLPVRNPPTPPLTTALPAVTVSQIRSAMFFRFPYHPFPIDSSYSLT